eukprot:13524944-Heterocapsa_arctica.AAC.1
MTSRRRRTLFHQRRRHDVDRRDRLSEVHRVGGHRRGRLVVYRSDRLDDVLSDHRHERIRRGVGEVDERRRGLVL